MLLVVNFILVLGSRRDLQPFTSLQLKVAPLCPFQSCLLSVGLAYSPGLVYGWLLNDLGVQVSRDQTAVDAAWPQSSLQSSLLFLGSQDRDDGLVEHRLQPLLGQGRTFHIATRANLKRQNRAKQK